MGGNEEKATSFLGSEDWLDMLDEPIPEAFNFVWGEHLLVGHGEPTTSHCGKFGSFYGCVRVDLHDIHTLEGKNYKDKVYARAYFHSCDKPSCPICFKRGWAVRYAGKAEARLAEASKKFGLAEHIVCSVPPKDYDLPYKQIRSKVSRVLHSRGVVGGCIIFHGARYASPEEARKKKVVSGWRWSPHFHILGFILGGFRKCRRCKRRSNCFKGCGGFLDRAWQAQQKDGYLVKVLGKRKSVGGTVWYQLSHATYKRGKGRPHVITWFGNCSRRRLKVTVEVRKRVCPICKSELVKLVYTGSLSFCLDRNHIDFKREFFADLREGDDGIFMGGDVWSVAPSYRY